MDYTKSEFWIALAIGGSLCASASTVLQLRSKSPEDPNSGFKARAVLRDFCIGAFLSATIYMFIPDSISSMISGAQNVVLSQVGGAVSSMDSTAVGTDVELRLGPARF